ncbi:PEP-CTERM sorting domain-containing protein [Nitrosomonas sp.]|nr:PEP-CTERM sorting domain-containing protein [Nitrosomonas sp.]
MQTSIGSTSPIPKLETYAMLLAGLGLLGFVARRRKGTAVAV